MVDVDGGYRAAGKNTPLGMLQTNDELDKAVENMLAERRALFVCVCPHFRAVTTHYHRSGPVRT